MAEKKGLIGEFKEFIAKGNVMDMAVGVIIGGAFGTIITSLVNDVLMPLISLATGGINFNDWFVSLNGGSYKTLEEAKEAGASTLNYGAFISAVFNFLIIALCIFAVVKAFNAAGRKMKKAEEEAAPTTKKCPYCQSEIAIEATRCPHCTSELK